MSDAQLLAQLTAGREHVLRSVEGLPEDELHQVIVPSGWSIRRLLNHLAFDDEMFWISAVLGGDRRAIHSLHNGWASKPMTGTEAIAAYRREIVQSDKIVEGVNLDDPPRWVPPADVYGGPLMRDGREILYRVLAETSVHAGHLDIVRELLDGHQDLVVTS